MGGRAHKVCVPWWATRVGERATLYPSRGTQHTKQLNDVRHAEMAQRRARVRVRVLRNGAAWGCGLEPRGNEWGHVPSRRILRGSRRPGQSLDGTRPRPARWPRNCGTRPGNLRRTTTTSTHVRVSHTTHVNARANAIGGSKSRDSRWYAAYVTGICDRHAAYLASTCRPWPHSRSCSPARSHPHEREGPRPTAAPPHIRIGPGRIERTA